jgi:phenylalanine-4-hydroxylase|tara:strand:+ start:411 stop:1343 length:933 start_codon:yes stop_codon:yes gene_type:complete
MVSQSTKYDHLFKNVIPNSIEGIKIFGVDDPYIIHQKYDDVTNLENRIWGELFQKLEFLLDQYASCEYLLGLRTLPIPNNMFPKFESISPLIENSTGWTLVPVAGFLDEELFFEINKKRQFPVTDIIRQSPRFDEKYAGIDIQNDKGYTPEPDIFHDIQAHVPFLMNKDYAQFMLEIGVLGDEIIKDHRGLGSDLVSHNLKRLQNYAWWTYEYGLIKNTGESDTFRRVSNDIDYEIYGAGIISSYDELTNVVECAKGLSDRSKFVPYDIEELVITCFDYSNIQDRYYVIESMESLYDSFQNNKELFRFEG